MGVLDGPREEWRRIFHEGQPKWVKPEGDALLLGDGRRIAEAEVTYLPPCEPSKETAAALIPGQVVSAFDCNTSLTKLIARSSFAWKRLWSARIFISQLFLSKAC